MGGGEKERGGRGGDDFDARFSRLHYTSFSQNKHPRTKFPSIIMGGNYRNVEPDDHVQFISPLQSFGGSVRNKDCLIEPLPIFFVKFSVPVIKMVLVMQKS